MTDETTSTPTTNDVPVPPDVRLVVSFLNSIHRDDEGTSHERFTDPDALAGWLHRRGLLPAGAALASDAPARAREVRDALRAVLIARQDGEDAPAAALARLNEAGSRARAAIVLGPDGAARVAFGGDPLDVAVAEILDALRRAQEAGHASRLKLCRLDTCRWAYYDASKNRSRAWCDMASCGNKVKARAYRARKRG